MLQDQTLFFLPFFSFFLLFIPSELSSKTQRRASLNLIIAQTWRMTAQVLRELRRWRDAAAPPQPEISSPPSHLMRSMCFVRAARTHFAAQRLFVSGTALGGGWLESRFSLAHESMKAHRFCMIASVTSFKLLCDPHTPTSTLDLKDRVWPLYSSFL